MQIAIIGAGFCGAAVAWHLAQHDTLDITVFDANGFSNSTSSIAAGLLHPYVGAHAKLNWRGWEGMKATSKLLDESARALNMPVASHTGMLRLASNQQQAADFLRIANQYDDIALLEPEDCVKAVPGLLPHPGIYIPSAITVDCERYLNGLWLYCSRRGIKMQKRAISALAELPGYDHIIVAMGSSTSSLPELGHLPLTKTKGQILEIAWPPHLSKLPYPINSQAYVLSHPRQESCIAGATFEKQFVNDEPDIERAMNEILPKLNFFFPVLSPSTILNCRSGIRAGMPNRKPLAARMTERCWVLTGMGSKGLLYHALFAEELVRMIMQSS